MWLIGHVHHVFLALCCRVRSDFLVSGFRGALPVTLSFTTTLRDPTFFGLMEQALPPGLPAATRPPSSRLHRGRSGRSGRQRRGGAHASGCGTGDRKPGTDVAMESADVVLMRSDPYEVLVNRFEEVSAEQTPAEANLKLS